MGENKNTPKLPEMSTELLLQEEHGFESCPEGCRLPFHSWVFPQALLLAERSDLTPGSVFSLPRSLSKDLSVWRYKALAPWPQVCTALKGHRHSAASYRIRWSWLRPPLQRNHCSTCPSTQSHIPFYPTGVILQFPQSPSSHSPGSLLPAHLSLKTHSLWTDQR